MVVYGSAINDREEEEIREAIVKYVPIQSYIPQLSKELQDFSLV